MRLACGRWQRREGGRRRRWRRGRDWEGGRGGRAGRQGGGTAECSEGGRWGVDVRMVRQGGGHVHGRPQRMGHIGYMVQVWCSGALAACARFAACLVRLRCGRFGTQYVPVSMSTRKRCQDVSASNPPPAAEFNKQAVAGRLPSRSKHQLRRPARRSCPTCLRPSWFKLLHQACCAVHPGSGSACRCTRCLDTCRQAGHGQGVLC